MAHDIFISYPAETKPTADAVTAALERAGMRCWIAPRDVTPGSDWSEAIVDAIQSSRLMVLIFNDHANKSQHIKRELERAVDANIPIIPMRLEDVPPSKGLSYFISSPHWLDAISPPLERHLDQLVTTARALLGNAIPTAALAPIAYAPVRDKSESNLNKILLAAGLGIITCVAIGGIGLWRAQMARVQALAQQQAAAAAAQQAFRAQSTASTQTSPPGTGFQTATAAEGYLRKKLHLDRFAEHLESLDKAVAALSGNGIEVQLYRQTMRLLGQTDVDSATVDEFARRITDLPLYDWASMPDFPAGELLLIERGAQREACQYFRELLPMLKTTADHTTEALKQAAAMKRLDRLRNIYDPSLASLPSSYGDSTIGVYARGYVLMANMTYLAAIHVLGPVDGADAAIGKRLANLASLPPVDLARYDRSTINAYIRGNNEIWEETREMAPKLTELHRSLVEKTIESWCAEVPAEARPAVDDELATVVAKARALRAIGLMKQSEAVLLTMGLMFVPADAYSVEFAENAITFGRSCKALGVAGGLQISNSKVSEADKLAGISPGNVLLSYNGKPVTTRAELADAMRDAPTTGQIPIEFASFNRETGAWTKHAGRRTISGPIAATLLPM